MGLALVTLASTIHAQQADEPIRLAFRIENFSSDHRDALARELNVAGEYRIAFACVPAGILLLERVGAPLNADDLEAMTNTVKHVVPTGRSLTHTPGLSELEAQCAAARNE
mgnify:CR=1 FL=1